MLVIPEPAAVSSIADSDMRALLERRFEEICAGEPYDYDLHGYMIVVEPGDSIDVIEEETGCAILYDLIVYARYGQPDYSPSFDALEEHAGCYEMVFILNDGGFGVGIFIPKRQGVDAELLAMCAEYAVPAPELTQP